MGKTEEWRERMAKMKEVWMRLLSGGEKGKKQ